MTDARADVRGTGARWGVAAVVAPVAAGALALATGWAVQHDPTGSVSTPTAAPAHLAERLQPPDKVLIGLTAQAAAARDRVVSLTHALARLQARTQRIRDKRLPVVPSGAAVQVAAPPRVSVAAPAPAAHASTGAS